MSERKESGEAGNGRRLPVTATPNVNAVAARAAGLLRADGSLYAAVAGVFVLLPNAALQFALPSDIALEGALGVLLDPERSEAMRAGAAEMLAELLAPFITLAGLATVIAHVGYAAMVALMSPARPTVGEALLVALRCILPLMLALLLYVMLAYLIFVVPQIVLIPEGIALAAFVGAIVGLLAVLFTSAQLALTLPVIVIERELNPIKALLRSWRLTASGRVHVLGFWMVVAVMWLISLIVLTLVSMVLAGIPGPGLAATLIEGLLTGIFASIWGAIYCACAVAMRHELLGPEPAGAERELD